MVGALLSSSPAMANGNSVEELGGGGLRRNRLSLNNNNDQYIRSGLDTLPSRRVSPQHQHQQQHQLQRRRLTDEDNSDTTTTSTSTKLQGNNNVGDDLAQRFFLPPSSQQKKLDDIDMRALIEEIHLGGSMSHSMSISISNEEDSELI